MIYIGDYFAIGLVIILSVFFFDGKKSIRYMSTASKLFICCLFTTALTAVTDLITEQHMLIRGIPLWQDMLIHSLYFIVNIIATSSIALYLFTRILEHTHSRKCMRMAVTMLTSPASVADAVIQLTRQSPRLGMMKYPTRHSPPLARASAGMLT